MAIVAAMVGGMLCAVMATAAAQTTAPPVASDQSVLHLSETAQRDVPRDLLRATLAADAFDADPGKLQAVINRRMATALARIKQNPSVTIETGGYNVSREILDKAALDKGMTPRWHGMQQLTLTDKDFDELLALVGALQQQGLVLQRLTPDLSRGARQAVEDSLTDEALKRLQQRADLVATALGSKVLRFREITVGNVLAPVPIRSFVVAGPAQSFAAPAAAAPPPVAEAGSATVSITATAEIVLAPR